jgi:hypothetical protein
MSRELLFVLLATRAEFVDPKRCRKTLVGPMRRYLVRHDGKELAHRTDLPPASLIAHRLEAASDLAEFCGRCGRCAEEKILK